MDLGLFGGWAGMVGALVEAAVLYPYAVPVLRLAGKTTVGTARIFDFVSTVAMGTMIGSTIISKSIALATGLAGLTALVVLQWARSRGTPRSRADLQLSLAPARYRDDARPLFTRSTLSAQRRLASSTEFG